MISTMMHNIEHIEIKFRKLRIEHRDEPKKIIKLIITDEKGQTSEIDCFMTDSGTLNINQE